MLWNRQMKKSQKHLKADFKLLTKQQKYVEKVDGVFGTLSARLQQHRLS